MIVLALVYALLEYYVFCYKHLRQHISVCDWFHLLHKPCIDNGGRAVLHNK